MGDCLSDNVLATKLTNLEVARIFSRTQEMSSIKTIMVDTIYSPTIDSSKNKSDQIKNAFSREISFQTFDSMVKSLDSRGK